MTQSQTDLEQRLARMETQLERVLQALGGEAGGSRKANGVASLAGTPFNSALREVESNLSGTYGETAVRQQVADALYTLGDPEALDALGRIVALTPKLEYAATFVAAGPELLEEGLDMVRERAKAAGEDPSAVKERVAHSLSLLMQLTSRESTSALETLAAAAPDLAPFAQGAAKAAKALAQVEGQAALSNRLAETLIQLAETDTLEALTRLALLAPKLEYAAAFAAAGPELLEEGLEMVRAELEATGTRDLEARMAAAKRAVAALSAPGTLGALAQLGGQLDALAPAALGAAEGMRAIAEVEGAAATRARMAEAVMTLAEPETMDALVRLAALTPKLEYAAQFAAAGPELLEEGLELARKHIGSDQQVLAQLDVALDLAKSMTAPGTIPALKNLVSLLPVLGDPKAADALGKMAAFAPELTKVLPILPVAISLVEKLDVKLAQKLVDEITKPEALETLRELLDMAPGLVGVLQSLPVQPGTLHVLETVNQAVEDAAHHPTKMGPFGLLRALGDDRVQRAAGFAINVARALGDALDEAPKQLNAGK